MPVHPPPASNDDPFDGLVLDDDFIRSATKHEPTGQDRIARSQSLREYVDNQDTRSGRWARTRRRRRHWVRLRYARQRHSRGFVSLAIIVALVIGYTWWEGSRGVTVLWSGADAAPLWASVTNRPTPVDPESDSPLGRPLAAPSANGAYRFMATQPGSDEPVTYDPCRSIRIVVNERTMPAGAAGIVDEALEELSTISGLRFIIEGPTGESPTRERASFQPERYGDRWAPVLIAWSDAAEYPDLGGDVAGLGGSQAVDVAPRRLVYVSGTVYVDGNDAARMLRARGGRALVKAVILHELGHLIGLGHVEDPNELMNASNVGRVGYGNGDLVGIAALSSGECVKTL